MKFTKNNFVQKLIIILIVLMIFNIAVPKQVNAWDIGGILIKPITSLILSVVIVVDTTIGILLNGLPIVIGQVGGLIEMLVEDMQSGAETYLETAKKLYIGPDSIFMGKVMILDANIFKALDIREFESITAAFSSFSSFIDTAVDVTSPRISYNHFYKICSCYYI